MWRDIDTAPKDGTEILVARNNGCSWDYAVVRWSANEAVYPWMAEFNSYPEDRFDYWSPLKPPYGIT